MVRNDANLRTYMTELRDHALVATRKGGDGKEYLYVVLPDESVRKLAAGEALEQ